MCKRQHVVPLGSLFPLAFVVLPGPRGRNGKFRDGGAAGQLLGIRVLADESDDRKLIEVHVCSLFLPVCLGTEERVAAAPKPSECFLLGDRKNFILSSRECSEQ